MHSKCNKFGVCHSDILCAMFVGDSGSPSSASGKPHPQDVPLPGGPPTRPVQRLCAEVHARRAQSSAAKHRHGLLRFRGRRQARSKWTGRGVVGRRRLYLLCDY